MLIWNKYFLTSLPLAPIPFNYLNHLSLFFFALLLYYQPITAIMANISQDHAFGAATNDAVSSNQINEKVAGKTDAAMAQSSPDSPELSSTGSSDLDDNYNLYKQHEGEAPADATEAKKVLRKVDWRVMPVLFTLYLLQYLDKNGLNYVCCPRAVIPIDDVHLPCGPSSIY